MTENKFLKFEEDNSYKETLDREFERLTNGEISKEEFLEKYINRCTIRKSMTLEEYKNLPCCKNNEILLDDICLEKSNIESLNVMIGPFKVNDKIPNKKEDGTGTGTILVGKMFKDLEGVPTIRLEVDIIDIIF